MPTLCTTHFISSTKRVGYNTFSFEFGSLVVFLLKAKRIAVTRSIYNYLRNRKHARCFYRVIETRVEVWENELFRVLLNFRECFYLTNRFHVAVRLFNNKSQMTSKCGKSKKVAHEA